MPPAKKATVADDPPQSKPSTISTSTSMPTLPPVRNRKPSSLQISQKQPETPPDTTISSPKLFSIHDSQILHSYRHARRIPISASYSSFRNQCLLTNKGFGKRSPTAIAASRKRGAKVSKEQLLAAVKHDFSNAAVVEMNVAVEMLYRVRNLERTFRLRSCATRRT